MVALIIIIVIVVLLVFGLWLGYNGLVRKRNRTQEAWSEIDIELKRRHDLIPNLVSTVQGYATHEQGTFEAVTQARANAVSAGATEDPSKIAPAENALTGTLRSLFAVAENYPDLKANQNVMALQEELTTTENKISFARQFYNDSVMAYNTKIQQFPSNTIAGMFNFTQRQFFEGDTADREVPQVDLGMAPQVQMQAPVAPVQAQQPPAPPVQPPGPPQQPGQ